VYLKRGTAEEMAYEYQSINLQQLIKRLVAVRSSRSLMGIKKLKYPAN